MVRNIYQGLDMKHRKTRLKQFVGVFFLAAGSLLIADFLLAGPVTKSGIPLLRFMAILAMVPGLTALFSLATLMRFAGKKKPIAEWMMINRLYWLLGILAFFAVVFYGLGVLGKVSTLLSLFGRFGYTPANRAALEVEPPPERDPFAAMDF